MSLAMQGNGASSSLTYSAAGLPPGLSIDSQSGLVSGTISATADTGSPYQTTVTLSDGTNVASQSFSWYVGQPSVLALDSPGDQTNAAGDVVSLQLSATDWNTPLLTYSAAGLPNGLSIDPNTGLISGTLTNSAASSTPYQVTATVSDGTNTVSQTFQWTVNYIGVTNPGDQFNNDGESVSLAVTANDALNQPLSYTATGLPPGLSIDSQSGLISGTIASTADTNSPYAITVSATDGTYSASQTFSWYVSPQPSLSLDSPGDQVNAAGDVVAVELSTLDSSLATLTYSATGLPPGLSIDPSAGIISGTLANDAASSAPYQVTATVTDGTNTVSQSFLWTVNFVGLDNPGDQNNLDGDSVSLALSGNDASGQALTYSAAGLPPGLSMNPQTALISGTIAASADTNSPYETTVTATDGVYSASQTFQWNVSPQPAISLTNPGDQVNNAGDVVSLQLTATDAAGSTMTYSATDLPAGLTLNTSTGLISGTLPTNAVSNTPYLVTVTVSDGTNSDSQTFGWRVSAQGSPQMDVPGDTLATAEPVQFDASGLAQINGVIGDNSYGSLDVDLYAIQMAAGDSLTLTNQTSSATASNDPSFSVAVRIFDSSGNELANAGEGVGLQIGDGLTFTATTSGTYYVGVSSYGNTAYNPQIAGSGVAGTTGAYSFTFAYTSADQRVAQQWTVNRDPRKDWAVVQAGNPRTDTIAGLAKLIGLDPNQASNWLSWHDPNAKLQPPGQADEEIIKAINDNPNQPLINIFPSQTKFWVPNRVVAYWGGEFSNLGRAWVSWNEDLKALLKKGYHVEYAGYEPKTTITVTPPKEKPGATEAQQEAAYIEWRTNYYNALWQAGLKNGWKEAPMTGANFLKLLADGTGNKSLLGVVLWGHGGKDGVLLNATVNGQKAAENYSVTYDDWQNTEKGEKYKLGLGILYACETSNANSKERLDKKPPTNVFSTNAIFWGVNGTLIPPLCPPLIEKVLGEFKEIQIGTATARPLNVQAILNTDKNKEVK